MGGGISIVNAISRGKARSEVVMKSGAVGGSISLNEDVLTSSVFERLLYLPEQRFWGILSAATGNATNVEALPAEPNEIVEATFWPSFSFTEALLAPAAQRREPDLVIRTPRLILIIESKLETAEQYPLQWAEQVLAVRGSIGPELPIVHLAIGGFGRFPSLKRVEEQQAQARTLLGDFAGSALNVRFEACSWYQLASAVSQERPSFRNERRLLRDVLNALSWYGIRPSAWLETLAVESVELDITLASLETIGLLGVEHQPKADN